MYRYSTQAGISKFPFCLSMPGATKMQILSMHMQHVAVYWDPWHCCIQLPVTPRFPQCLIIKHKPRQRVNSETNLIDKHQLAFSRAYSWDGTVNGLRAARPEFDSRLFPACLPNIKKVDLWDNIVLCVSVFLCHKCLKAVIVDCC